VLDRGVVMYEEEMDGLEASGMGNAVMLIGEFDGAMGVSSIVVTHAVRDVRAIPDHLSLLADGRVLGHG